MLRRNKKRRRRKWMSNREEKKEMILVTRNTKVAPLLYRLEHKYVTTVNNKTTTKY